jgi:ABC-2 type transport system ATP-binding protein
MSAIEVRELARTYETKTGVLRRRKVTREALKGISFHVERGEIFGLLGPNGAGKTTTIKILTTLLLPTAGSARVLGHDVARRPQDVRLSIGYVFGGDRGLYERLSGLDNLRYFADLYRVLPAARERRIQDLLDLVGLSERARDRVERYSRGMKQRLHIARGLLHDPPVMFLDEPTIGLDPVSARDLRALVQTLSAAGKTVLLTTHYMFEADQLCDRIAVIDRGRIVTQGTPHELKGEVRGGSVIELELFGADERTLERLRRIPGVEAVGLEVREQAQLVVIRADGGGELLKPVLRELSTIRLGRVTTRDPTLEDAYLHFVGPA